jgi:small conductance mechanosensitive channel
MEHVGTFYDFAGKLFNPLQKSSFLRWNHLAYESQATKISVTLAVLAIILIFRASTSVLIRRKLGRLTGYQNLTNLITGIFTVSSTLYLLFLWDIPSLLIGILAPLGALGVVLLFALKDLWIQNFFAGISLIGDKSIKVGTEVEIAGVKGRIAEMTLTVTKVKTEDGRLMIVPNRKFKEDVITIKIQRG